MELKIFTDGSCKGNGKDNAPGGWAFVLSLGFDRESIIYYENGKEENTTNNKMEMTAIVKSLEFINKYPEDVRKFEGVRIYTDSAYLHNCYLQKWYLKWEKNGWKTTGKKPVKNKDLWEKIIPYFKDNFYHFEKVKGHSDCEINNFADYLATT